MPIKAIDKTVTSYSYKVDIFCQWKSRGRVSSFLGDVKVKHCQITTKFLENVYLTFLQM